MYFVEFLEDVHSEDSLAKVPLVQFALEHNFIQSLDLGQRELPGKQLKSDGLVPHLVPESIDGDVEYRLVVERQIRNIVNAKPGGVACVRGRVDLMLAELYQSIIGNRDNALPGVAIDRAKGVELLEVHTPNASFLAKLSEGCIIDGFVDLNEAPGQSPGPLERPQSTLDEEDLQVFFIQIEPKNDAIDS